MNFYFVIAAVIILILVIICLIITTNNSSKLNTLINYSDDGDLICAIEDYYTKVEELAANINSKTDTAILNRIDEIEAKNVTAFSKVGIVNFDAFDDVKGSLSFALTLLNENNDGFILTTLYGHNSCNTYVRKINSGTTNIKLLDEEKQSLEKAKNRGSGEENG